MRVCTSHATPCPSRGDAKKNSGPAGAVAPFWFHDTALLHTGLIRYLAAPFVPRGDVAHLILTESLRGVVSLPSWLPSWLLGFARFWFVLHGLLRLLWDLCWRWHIWNLSWHWNTSSDLHGAVQDLDAELERLLTPAPLGCPRFVFFTWLFFRFLPFSDLSSSWFTCGLVIFPPFR